MCQRKDKGLPKKCVCSQAARTVNSGWRESQRRRGLLSFRLTLMYLYWQQVAFSDKYRICMILPPLR